MIIPKNYNADSVLVFIEIEFANDKNGQRQLKNFVKLMTGCRGNPCHLLSTRLAGDISVAKAIPGVKPVIRGNIVEFIYEYNSISPVGDIFKAITDKFFSSIRSLKLLILDPIFDRSFVVDDEYSIEEYPFIHRRVLRYISLRDIDRLYRLFIIRSIQRKLKQFASPDEDTSILSMDKLKSAFNRVRFDKLYRIYRSMNVNTEYGRRKIWPKLKRFIIKHSV